MNILGLYDGQTSGTAVVVDGELVAAVNEERLVRIKQARGFPRASIQEALELADLRPDEVDGVAVAGVDMALSEEVRSWDGWFRERDTADDLHNLFFQVAGEFASVADRIPLLKRLYYAIRSPRYRKRRKRIRQILRDEFDISAPVRFYHHHFAHAAAAYAASGFEDALVVTMDGGGDRDSSHVYSVREGEWQQLKTVDAYDSLGNYYAYVTALCGFKAKKHEGKITGLSARGEPKYRDVFGRHITYEDGGTRNVGRVLFQGALKSLRESLPAGWTREDLAATVQETAEDLARSHVSHWLEETGHSRVALAGGLFANVRINQEVKEIPGVDEVFVFPGMTDEGLSPGAAWAMHDELVEEKPRPTRQPGRIRDVFLGPTYSEEQMAEALRASELEFERHDEPAEAIADRLAEGAVVARFAGRLEFGPRALGHRSILYQPTDPTVQDWLNECLDRTEFMPFAPSVLLEAVDQCFVDPEGALDTARFMTITFHCTPWMQKNCPGVVHVDGTARPQLVDREEDPEYWAIIDAYRRRTGLPAIINTSFNMHEEPIVCSPEDAVRAFQASNLDFLALGPFLAEGETDTSEVRSRYGAPQRKRLSARSQG